MVEFERASGEPTAPSSMRFRQRCPPLVPLAFSMIHTAFLRAPSSPPNITSLSPSVS